MKKTYYQELLENAEELNEIFKAEGSTDRAIVIKNEEGRYKIIILKHRRVKEWKSYIS